MCDASTILVKSQELKRLGHETEGFTGGKKFKCDFYANEPAAFAKDYTGKPIKRNRK